MGGEFGVCDGEDAVDEGDAPVDAVHRAADVAWTGCSQEAVEGHVGFGLGARGVEEGGAQYVHSLHVDSWFGAAACFGGGGRYPVESCACACACGAWLLHVRLHRVCMLEFGAAEVGGGVVVGRRRSAGVGVLGGYRGGGWLLLLRCLLTFLFRVVQGPCYSIEETD